MLGQRNGRDAERKEARKSEHDGKAGIVGAILAARIFAMETGIRHRNSP